MTAEREEKPTAEGPAFRYRPRGRVLPADEVHAWETGRSFMAAARQEADRLSAEAVSAYEETKRQGFEDGRQEGAADAASLLAATAVRADRHLADADAEVVDLALAVVRQVLGDFDVAQLTRNAVRHALVRERQSQHLTLHASPDMIEPLRAELDQHIDHGVRHLITVEPDASMDLGQCRLASDTGFVDLGVEAQLKAIHRGLRDGLDRQTRG